MFSKMIVLASYNNDLSFLQNDYLKAIPHTIYEKGRGDTWKQNILEDSTTTMEDFVEIQDNTIFLPNIGLCGHVFLYHIVKNYDNLADINIFIAGDCLEDKRHRSQPPEYYYKMILEFNENSDQYVNITQKTGNYPLRSYAYRFFNDRIREKWEDLFEEKCPTKFEPAIDSTFMATKAAILSRPKSFYEKALSWIDERCYREDHWKMEWDGDTVSVLAPAKKNLQKFPHKSPRHFEFPACGFFEHSYQKMFDPKFDACIIEK